MLSARAQKLLPAGTGKHAETSAAAISARTETSQPVIKGTLLEFRFGVWGLLVSVQGLIKV